ncbi:hypothetical protein [Streptomyces sp. NPDC048639]|uniref:hypothetical protein n=1 Tax=Streptomyces sp. NPDC048639 TaxID=3365581 RepID=UPI00371C0D22
MTSPHTTDGSWWPDRSGALPSAQEEDPTPPAAEGGTGTSAYGDGAAYQDGSAYGDGAAYGDGSAYDDATDGARPAGPDMEHEDAGASGASSLAAARQRIAERRSEGGVPGPASEADRTWFDPVVTPHRLGVIPPQDPGLGAERDADRITGAAALPGAARPASPVMPVMPVTPAASARHGASDPFAVPRCPVEPEHTPTPAHRRPVESGPAVPQVSAQTRRSARPASRRGPADPVKALMHRHRALCERAIDPLEIAAGLEAHGVTDRTAARFRHRDVFSLAEELYARVPRAEYPAHRPRATAPEAPPAPRSRRLLYLLPGAGAACAAATLGAEAFVTAGQPVRLGIAAAGAVAVAVALRLCVRRGPLSLRGAAAGTAPLWTCWLLGHLLVGDALLAQWAGAHGPLWPLAAAPDAAAFAAPAVVALAFAVAPAAWCARWFAVRARSRLAASRGLEDFSAGIRPSLPVATGLFLAALVTLLMAARAAALAAGGWYGAVHHDASYAVLIREALSAAAAPAALGALIFVARLLAVHGRPSAAARGLAAACAVEALALGAAAAARLPGCGVLGRPVEAVVARYGPGTVPLAACAAAALLLLVHATVTLSRAEAHTRLPADPR